jgi:hypothetical protein
MTTPAAPVVFDRRAGRLPIEPLEQHEENQAEASLPDEDTGKPKGAFLLRYLHRARDAALTVERAFAAVLSDVLPEHQSSLESLEEIAISSYVMSKAMSTMR